jgi:hypothetical protein
MNFRQKFVMGLALSALAAGAFAADPLHPSYKGPTWHDEMVRDFKSMDTNKDGNVDMGEWQAHRNPLHPEYAKDHAKPGTPRLTEQELDSIWKSLSNGNKIVTMEEWVNHRNPLHPQYEAKHPLPGQPQSN